MIGYFPPRYVDECLYSTAARYKGIFREQSSKAVSQDFFGTKVIGDIVDIPGRLRFLSSQLPLELGITTALLIDHASAFPYFSPFLTPDSSAKAIADFTGSILDGVPQRH
jgi:hypothetical protein